MRRACQLIVVVSALLLAACQTPSPPAATPQSRLGDDIDHPVVIETTGGEIAGIRIERAWLALRYPHYRQQSQALIPRPDGRHVDCINILTAEGKPLSVYFDITSFFGKTGS